MNYVAFLRGINVGGNKKIRMVDLKDMFEKMKFSNVKTYINSGNVLFDTAEKEEEKLTKKIEETIQKTFGFEVKVMIRSIEELKEILAHNPFKNPPAESMMYISFLYDKLDADTVKSVEALSNEVYTFKLRNKELYMLRQKDKDPLLAGKDFKEKNLGGTATNRNINTIRKIVNL